MTSCICCFHICVIFDNSLRVSQLTSQQKVSFDARSFFHFSKLDTSRFRNSNKIILPISLVYCYFDHLFQLIPNRLHHSIPGCMEIRIPAKLLSNLHALATKKMTDGDVHTERSFIRSYNTAPNLCTKDAPNALMRSVALVTRSKVE